MLDLETALQIGGANNFLIKEYKQQQEIAVANLAKSKEWWLPDLYTGTKFHQLWGNAMNGDGNFFTGVNRQSFWGGAGVTANWDFGTGAYRVKAAEHRIEAAMYRTEAETNQLLLQIVENYYSLLLAQMNMRAYQLIILQTDSIIDQIQLQVDAGLRYESEMLLARSGQKHLMVVQLNAQLEYSQSSAALTRLLALDPKKKILCSDSVIAPLDLKRAQLDIASNDSAYSNRAEIKSLESQIKGLEAEKKTTTTGLWAPDLNVAAYGSFFSDVFSTTNPTSEINVGLIWDIPLGRLAYKGDLKRFNAEIGLREIQIEHQKVKINQEILQAYQQISFGQRKINLAKEEMEIAALAMSQSLKRQEEGTIRPFELIEVQKSHLQATLDYFEAVTTYNLGQFRYMVAVGKEL